MAAHGRMTAITDFGLCGSIQNQIGAVHAMTIGAGQIGVCMEAALPMQALTVIVTPYADGVLLFGIEHIILTKQQNATAMLGYFAGIFIRIGSMTMRATYMLCAMHTTRNADHLGGIEFGMTLNARMVFCAFNRLGGEGHGWSAARQHYEQHPTADK